MHDTDRVNTLNLLSREYYRSNTDTSIVLCDKAAELAKRTGFNMGLANSLRNKGVFVLDKGDPDQAMKCYQASLDLSTQLNDKAGMAKTLGNMALVFLELADYRNTIDYCFKALQIDEKLGNRTGIARHYGHIGLAYARESNYPKALDFYLRSLKISEELKDDKAVAIQLGNIGIVYRNQVNYTKALDYYFRALKVAETLGNKQLLANTYGNIGIVYNDLADYPRALEYYLKRLKLDEETGNKYTMAINLGNIGTLYSDQGKAEKSPEVRDSLFSKALHYYQRALQAAEETGNLNTLSANLANVGVIHLNNAVNMNGKKGQQEEFRKAEQYFLKATEIAEQIGTLDYVRNNELSLSQLYDTTGRYRLALQHYRKYAAVKDSIVNKENTTKIVQQEMQFGFDKKEALARADQEKRDAIAREELEKQKMQRNGLFGGCVLMIGLAAVSFKSYRNKKKANSVISRQKDEVEKQKHIVEVKQREILDSINYARRIQEAILPSRYSLAENLSNGFVLFRPKDVVSGDFYWIERMNDTLFFAAADCTGHGVPGALVSVVCSNALSKALLEERITDPGRLLDRTRQLVVEQFARSGEDVKDGMDISLCCLTGLHLSWAGANNPLWVFGSGGITDLKPDKQPIGSFANNKPFSTHQLELGQGDTLYLFTDGFSDQFGGENGKKFKAANFKRLLASIQDQPIGKHRELINETFERWKGALEQVDDVCVIGLRV